MQNVVFYLPEHKQGEQEEELFVREEYKGRLEQVPNKGDMISLRRLSGQYRVIDRCLYYKADGTVGHVWLSIEPA